jgi:hypothetical protein
MITMLWLLCVVNGYLIYRAIRPVLVKFQVLADLLGE